MGFLVHSEPGGQVPFVVLLARNSTLGPASPYCTHCESPWNLRLHHVTRSLLTLPDLSGVLWKQSSVSSSPALHSR